jgi:hypothetical protein
MDPKLLDWQKKFVACIVREYADRIAVPVRSTSLMVVPRLGNRIAVLRREV